MMEELRRSMSLRKLLEEQLAKTDPKKPEKERMAEAQGLLDKILGPEWRSEAELPEGVTVIEVVAPAESEMEEENDKAEEFWCNVEKELDKAGYTSEATRYNKGRSDKPEVADKRKKEDSDSGLILNILEKMLDEHFNK